MLAPYKLATHALSLSLQINMADFPQYSTKTKRRKINAKVAEHMRSLEIETEFEQPTAEDCSISLLFSEDTEASEIADQLTNEADAEEYCSIDDIDYYSCIEDCENEDYYSYDEDSEEEDLEEEPFNLREELAHWALQYNISNAALRALLQILRSCGLDLPKDPRTLLQTPINYDIKDLAGGKYCHIGLESNIKSVLNSTLCDTTSITHLTLHINVDGLPIFDSSSVHVWPILGRIKEFPDCEPFAIGIYSGTKKPTSADEYLRDFVDEIKVLHEDGFTYLDRNIKVTLDAAICDAPARAFVKCIKGHSGYSACERCTQTGVHTGGRNGKMTYPEINSSLRTNEQFNEMTDEDHHTGISPLNILYAFMGFGLVSHFPLDYMHLVCLGVVRKLIKLWVKGPLPTRMPHNVVSMISGLLLNVRSCIPSEFVRRPRSLLEISQWKATELRQFLLYSGPVVLCGKIPKLMYRNFLLLSVSIRILLSPQLCSEYSDYAQQLLESFIQNFGRIYGQDMLIYNIHNLVHLVQDAKRYGTLDNVSAFPFESFLGKLKRLVRGHQFPLAQLVRRIGERQKRPLRKKTTRSMLSGVRRQHASGPLPADNLGSKQYKHYYETKFKISKTRGNNCFMYNNSVILVRNIIVSADGETHAVIESFRKKDSLFNYPLPSSTLGIFRVSGLSGKHDMIPISSITQKMVLLPCKSGFAALPLIHHQ